MISKRKVRFLIENRITWLLGLSCRTQKAILFESFGGKQYSDNPRAISEKMHELYPEYELYWSLAEKKDTYQMIPDYVKIVPNKGVERLKTMARVFAFVTNEANETNLYKRPEQFVIQTWHGDRVPKKVIYDAWEGQKRPIPVIDGKVTDLCIAASDIGESVYHTAFRYNGPIFREGMPRNDKLICSNPIEQLEIKKKLQISNDEKILLFAPTFRDNATGKQNVVVDLKSVLKKLSVNGEKWRCMIRAHSASAGLEFGGEGDLYLDVSQYPDMADLLSISDMLITDYSSCAGDFILRHKPVILAMFDYEEYVKNCRSFNFIPKEAGFIIAMNQRELELILDTYSDKDYSENCESIIRHFNITESGNSAAQICEIINIEYTNRILKKKV